MLKFCNFQTHYNVVFFDDSDVTRAWIAPDHLMPYKDSKKILTKSLKVNKYRKRLNAAIAQANDAEKLKLAARLAKYSFISRYNGSVLSPKIFKKAQLQKFQNKLKRKFNIDFSEGFSESENEEDKEDDEKSKKRYKTKKVNKKSAKVDDSQKSLSLLPNTTLEKCSINTTKDLNSLTAELDSGSSFIQSNLSTGWSS